MSTNTPATPSVIHNWLLLALVSIVSFGGAVLYVLIPDPDSPVFLGYFVVMAALVAGVAFWWFGRRPPRLTAPGWRARQRSAAQPRATG